MKRGKGTEHQGKRPEPDLLLIESPLLQFLSALPERGLRLQTQAQIEF